MIYMNIEVFPIPIIFHWFKFGGYPPLLWKESLKRFPTRICIIGLQMIYILDGSSIPKIFIPFFKTLAVSDDRHNRKDLLSTFDSFNIGKS